MDTEEGMDMVPCFRSVWATVWDLAALMVMGTVMEILMGILAIHIPMDTIPMWPPSFMEEDRCAVLL